MKISVFEDVEKIRPPCTFPIRLQNDAAPVGYSVSLKKKQDLELP